MASLRALKVPSNADGVPSEVPLAPELLYHEASPAGAPLVPLKGLVEYDDLTITGHVRFVYTGCLKRGW